MVVGIFGARIFLLLYVRFWFWEMYGNSGKAVYYQEKNCAFLW